MTPEKLPKRRLKINSATTRASRYYGQMAVSNIDWKEELEKGKKPLEKMQSMKMPSKCFYLLT